MTASIGLVLFDSVVLPVALPTIQTELGIGWPWLEWVLNGYFLTMVALSIAGGRITDLYGNRRIYCLGMTTFVMASVVGGFAPSAWWLIGARAMQGAGAALIWPSSMSMIVDTFPLSKRGQALGVTMSISSVLLAIGPMVGGVVTEFVTWRWLFWINLPVGMMGVVMVLASMPQAKKLDDSFDCCGFIALLVGSFSLIGAFMLVKQFGWSHELIRWMGFIGALSLSAVPLIGKFAKHPFVDFSIFKNRLFVGGTALATAAQFVLMTVTYWVIFLQKSLLFTPLKAGLMMVFCMAPSLVIGPISGYLCDRYGPKTPTFIGFVCTLLSILLAWTYTLVSFFPVFVLALFVFGCGSALYFTPVAVASISDMPERQRGIAYATYNSVRFVGSIVGVLTLGTVNNFVRMGKFATFIEGHPLLCHLDPKIAVKAISTSKMGHYFLPDLSRDLLAKVRMVYLEYSFFALNMMNLVTGLVAVIAIILAFIYFPSQRRLRCEK